MSDASAIPAHEQAPLLLPGTDRMATLRPPSQGDRLVSAGGQTMGTTWAVSAFLPEGVTETGLAVAVGEVLDSIIEQMSHWRADSEISLFNAAPAGTGIGISADFAHVLGAALDLAEKSDGAFDPGLHDAVCARGFGPQRDLAASGPAAHWRALDFVRDSARLRQPGGLRLDLSAIAKGHAVDAVGEAVAQLGAKSFLAEIGGEFVARGLKPDMMPWLVSLEGPDAAPSRWRAGLADMALATSGDYRRCRLTGDGRVSHIVGVEGAGEPDLASVTVIHDSCMMADGWATALMAAAGRGMAMSLDLAKRHGLVAVFQFRAGNDILSPAAESWLS